MYTTYHLTSAQEVSTDILDAIKDTFKSKPITIIVEEDENENIFGLTSDMKAVLDERCRKMKKPISLPKNPSTNSIKNMAYEIIVSPRT